MRLIPHTLLIASLSSSGMALANSVTLTATDREQQAVTIYNQNLARVEAAYTLPVLKPGSRVQLTDISPQLLPESLQFSHSGTLLNQGYQAANLSYTGLLQSSLNQPLTLARTNPSTGEESRRRVTLRALDSQFALVESDSGIESIPLNGPWRFIFTQIKPAQAQAYFTSGGTRRSESLQAGYMTRGLSWAMSYQLILEQNPQQATLQGLASIQNQTRHTFHAAPLQLMAGDISAPQAKRFESQPPMLAMARDSAPQAERESIQGQHLYSIEGPVTLAASQLTQLPLFEPLSLKAETDYQHEFRLYPRPDSQRYTIKPQARLTLTNTHRQQAKATPLPAGQVQIMRRDKQDRLQMVGNDQLPALAAEQSTKLNLGRAFDLTLTRYQTSYRETYQGALIDYRVDATNAGNAAETLDLRASFPNEWTIKSSNLKQQNTLGGAAHWQLEVPAKGSQSLEFQVEIKKR